MTFQDYRGTVRQMVGKTEAPYTHVKLHPEDFAELLGDEEIFRQVPLGGGPVKLMGYQVQGDTAVPRGEAVFHSPDCAGTYRVAA